MRQRRCTALLLVLLAISACSPAPSSQPTSNPATGIPPTATTRAVPTWTALSPSAAQTAAPGLERTLPTLDLSGVIGTPQAVPTISRDIALPTPVMPAGSRALEGDFEPITADNLRQLVLLAEIRSDDGINSNLVFSPDDRWLVAGSSTGVIHVWDASTGEEAFRLEEHTSRVKSIVFSPDGRLMASGSWDKTVILWDTATWTPLRTLLGHEHYVGRVAFSPDGSLLASGGIPLIVWDVATGEQLYTLNASGLIPEDLEFSPDGSLLASAHGENDFFIWRTADGGLEHTLVGDTTTSYLAFSSEGMLAASSSSFSAGVMNPRAPILFWDPWSGTRLGGTQETAAVMDLLFSADSSLLITCGYAGRDILFWQTTNGLRIWGLTGHPRSAYALALNSDGTLLASGDLDGRILLWAVQGE